MTQSHMPYTTLILSRSTTQSYDVVVVVAVVVVAAVVVVVVIVVGVVKLEIGNVTRAPLLSRFGAV